MHSYKHFVEFRPGKFIFVPTEEAKRLGGDIVSDLKKLWGPKEYFYHFGKRGGHVAAMRPHINNVYKASIDLKNFFTTVSRTKVARSLRSIGYSRKQAFSVATDSCVKFRGKKFVPYGFVQSMALATLVIEKSAVGVEIEKLRRSGIFISVFVDDILLSSNDAVGLQNAYEALFDKIAASGFEVSKLKCSAPSNHVDAFNCRIENGALEIDDDRMDAFLDSIKNGTAETRYAILKYVGVINKIQESMLERAII